MIEDYIKEVRGFRVFSEMNPELDFIIVPHEERFLSDIKPIISDAYDDWWKYDPCEPLSTYVVTVLAEHGYGVKVFAND